MISTGFIYYILLQNVSKQEKNENITNSDVWVGDHVTVTHALENIPNLRRQMFGLHTEDAQSAVAWHKTWVFVGLGTSMTVL